MAESLKTLSISRKSSNDMLPSLLSEVENTWQIRCLKGFACRHGNSSGRAGPCWLHQAHLGCGCCASWSWCPTLPLLHHPRHSQTCPVRLPGCSPVPGIPCGTTGVPRIPHSSDPWHLSCSVGTRKLFTGTVRPWWVHGALTRQQRCPVSARHHTRSSGSVRNCLLGTRAEQAFSLSSFGSSSLNLL